MNIDHYAFKEKKLIKTESEDAHRRYTDPQGKWEIHGIADGCGNNKRARFASQVGINSTLPEIGRRL